MIDRWHSVVFSFLCSLLVHGVCSKPQEELILTQILYRHGDRAPFDTYPTNPVPPSVWPDGYEQLTQKGMKQHYELGTYLRQRYMLSRPFHLLNETYSRSEIVIQSTDIDRTLMSAYSNLAGLYPPEGRQQWSEELKWQPIPVHTQPIRYDYMLHMEAYCPAYDMYFQKVMNSEEIKTLEAKNKEFYKYLEEKTGLNEISISNIWKLYDILLCQKAHDHGLPDWASAPWGSEQVTVYEKMSRLSTLFFDLQFNRAGEKRLRGGVLLKKMIDNMKLKASTDTAAAVAADSSPKAYVYSAHDDTIVALLSALNSFNSISPPYASTLMVELYRVQQTVGNTVDHQVKIFYRNDSKHEPYNITVPGCHVDHCSLQTFIQLLQDNTPSDWFHECNSAILFIPGSSTLGLIILPLVCLSVMLFSVVAFVAGVWRRTQRRYDTLPSEEGVSFKS